jgi:hypothetical protein
VPGKSLFKTSGFIFPSTAREKRRSMMNSKENLDILYEAGLSHTAIERLRKFRREHIEKDAVEQRRLAFVRWLVTTGRLSDSFSGSPASEENQKMLAYRQE